VPVPAPYIGGTRSSDAIVGKNKALGGGRYAYSVTQPSTSFNSCRRAAKFLP
jgi:hypothetical protein